MRVTVVVVLVALVAAAIWWRCVRDRDLVYSPEGFGGYVHANRQKHHKPTDPLAPAVDAYNRGKYRQAEKEAQRIIDADSSSKDPKKRRNAVEGRYVLAFSAARRKDMAQARERFAVLQSEAAKLPGGGTRASLPGAMQPSIEEEAAYQHAVCTAAMGDKKNAEAEYYAFLRKYPESPLIGQAAKRIGMMHGGRVPKEANAAWTKASTIAQARQEAREKARNKAMSLCGPECLAELLTRLGKTADASSIASELKTNERGTSLLAMVKTTKKHGLNAKGLRLTDKGLSKQPLPLIALVRPEHYVIVEKVTKKEIQFWDPSGSGLNKPSTRRCSREAWTGAWSGIAMVIQR